MVVHNVGIAADIERIGDLCRKYGLKLIEDAAESLGTTVNGRMTGTFGDAGVYSFNGNKIVTTGGGGILVTDDEQIYRRALHLSTTAKIPHEYAYIHDEIGYNYRMPNINAALGVAQIEQIEHFIMVKTEQAAAVSRYIESPDIEFYSPQGIRWNHWFVVGRLKGVEIHALIQALAKKNVMARPLWSKVSAMKPYRSFFAANNEVSSELSESVICLPNGVA
jgi:dTDP-4-amino-4,6-dideoxygalactose transaminase